MESTRSIALQHMALDYFRRMVPEFRSLKDEDVLSKALQDIQNQSAKAIYGLKDQAWIGIDDEVLNRIKNRSGTIGDLINLISEKKDHTRMPQPTYDNSPMPHPQMDQPPDTHATMG